MPFPKHKTKIVATIGPATDSVDMMVRLIRAGLNVARLNFSHGELSAHGELIGRLRAAERAVGRAVTIMADLPGPKMRLGQLDPDPVQLAAGATFTLTSEPVVGGEERASMSFEPLPLVVKAGDRLFLNDGIIQLRVQRVVGTEVVCQVEVGGELRSRKGLNLPGIHLGMSAFTPRDRQCLEYALSQGVDAVSQSFVETAADLQALRKAAAECGRVPFVIAKIERAGALLRLDEILQEADGIMVARGDLGVEVPIEEIAFTQKQLIAAANRLGKPVITATQMLESMTSSRLPTRAEATDVANAILDGTDCLMLSGESAMGKYPVEAVEMLGRIAAATERRRPSPIVISPSPEERPSCTAQAIAAVVEQAVASVPSSAIFVPTRTGTTARFISRFKPRPWIVAMSGDKAVCRNLAFSYGVQAVEMREDVEDWRSFGQGWLRAEEVPGNMAVLVTGPSPRNPDANLRIEFLRFNGADAPQP
jgi:pyruvate kinase